MTSSKMAAPMKLFCWGANNDGQLCIGHQRDIPKPTEVTEEFLGHINVSNVSQICGGGGHVIFLLNDGTMYSCGKNNCGQLGVDMTTTFPNKLNLIKDVTGNAIKVACGWEHTLCLTDDGRLWGWGSNTFNQLGLSPDVSKIYKPQLILVNGSQKVIDVASGLRHNLAVTEIGEMFVWGYGGRGQLGLSTENGEIIRRISTPTKVKTDVKIATVACGSDHSLALSENGKVYAWGCNKHGVTGTDPSNTQRTDVPTIVHLPNGEPVRKIHSGWSHVIAVTESNEIFTWGRNDYGQLGRTGITFRPTRMEIEDIKQISTGAEHTLGLKGDGKLVSWGWNEHGICGIDYEQNVCFPQNIESLQQFNVRFIGTGYGASFAVVL